MKAPRRPEANPSVLALQEAALAAMLAEPSPFDDPAEAPEEEAPVDGLAESDEAIPSAERGRKPRVLDPAIAALFDAPDEATAARVTAAQKCWREATQREAPAVERLAAPGVIDRIDVDEASGYLAVVTREDTYRAFVPREALPVVVALMLRRRVPEVVEALATGPGSLAPRAR